MNKQSAGTGRDGVLEPPPGPPPGAPRGEDGPAPSPPTLSRTARFAWGMVVIILIAVIALVVYVLTVPSSSQSAGTPVPTPPSVVDQLSRVPASVFDAVGGQVTAKPTPLTPPRVLSGQPRLATGGKPEVLFVGAEYCPFCAAERWSLVLALSRFGRFNGLHNTQSAGTSVFSGIQTFSFTGTGFDSPYLSFVGVELYSDELEPDGSFTRIASLTPAQTALIRRYGGAGHSVTTLPFVDIDNRMVASTSPFTPGLLTRKSQSALVAAIDQPTGVTGQAIVAGANQLTVGLCLATGQRPAAVCHSKGVQAAAASLGPG